MAEVSPSGRELQVRLPGPVDVLADGTSRPVKGLRRAAVLATLALRPGQVVSTDQLVDAVWGDRAPPTAATTLQNHVSYLRRLLGGRAAIRARPPGYLLDLGDDGTDVQPAERLLLTGTPAQLRQVWQEYGITAAVVRHNAPVYVIDPAGRVRREFRHDPGPGAAATSSSFAVLFADTARQALSTG